jgi:hypothetical protein
MEKAWEHLDQLADNSHVLTLRLWEAIHTCYHTPKLRRRLAEIPVSKFQAQLPGCSHQDLTYLLAGLMAVSGFEIQPFPAASLVQELGEYLKAGQKFGISISQFLKGSSTRWDEIRPHSQGLIRAQLTAEIETCFPQLKEEPALCMAHYLLANDFARIVPVFPFHHQTVAPVTIVRPRSDLRWTIVSEPRDIFETLYNHFPEVDWSSGDTHTHKVCHVGLRLLSPLSLRAAQVLKRSLSNLSYQATTRVQNKEKLLSLIFYHQSDANLFQFNLRHYSKFSTIHYQLVFTTLSDYRNGYPAWSGFFDPETIRQAGL